MRHRVSRLLTTLETSADDVAINFFIKSFVFSIKPAPNFTHFLHIVGEVLPKTLSTSPLSYAFTALSLSTLSKYPHFEHLHSRGTSFYGKALSLAKEGIGDPEKSKSDETLLAVMVLAMYEVSRQASGRLPTDA